MNRYYGRLSESQWTVVAIARTLYGKKRAKEVASKFAKTITKTHGGELKWNGVVSDDYSYIEKVGFDFVFTDEDWEEFNECYFYRINSWYDCTGKIFTVWMKKFVVNGRTIIYRKNAVDC